MLNGHSNFHLVLILSIIVSLSFSLSCRALTELVSTYISDNEDDIPTLVTELVVMAISDPDRYIFSDLLDIEAVKLQYSEKIYQVRPSLLLATHYSVCSCWKYFLQGGMAPS